MTKENNAVVPFGKYKGQPVEVLAADRQYVEWLSAQPWFQERYSGIYNIVVNVGQSEIADTPEHNALQIKFLDKKVCAAFARTCFNFPTFEKWRELARKRIAEREIELLKLESQFATKYTKEKYYGWEEQERNHCVNMINHNKDKIAFGQRLLNERTPDDYILSRVKFECNGWDVMLNIDAQIDVFTERDICIELKPTMGDDYPAVLRQIMRRKEPTYAYLIVGNYTGVGATYEQVKEFFGLSKITLVKFSEIEGM